MFARTKVFLLFLFISSPVFSNLNTIDSLLQVLKAAAQDTTRVKIENSVAMQIAVQRNKYDTALQLTREAIALAEKLGYKSGAANGYANMGSILSKQGNYSQALDNHLKCVKIWEELKDERKVASCYNNIGIVYERQSDFPAALEYYFKALKLAERQKELNGSTAFSYNNIGRIYSYQKNYTKSLEYFSKALQINQKLNQEAGEGDAYCNIGALYYDQSKFSQSLPFYLKALSIFQKINDTVSVSLCYNNIGNIYTEQGNYADALIYVFKSLQLDKETENIQAIGLTYLSISSLYLNQKKYKLAITYADSALKSSEDVDDISTKLSAYENLAVSYSGLGDYKSAFEAKTIAQQLNDSIYNEENTRQISDLKTNFEVSKREAELKAEQEKIDAISNEEKKRSRLILYAVCVFLLLAMILAVTIYRNLHKTKQVNKVIARQKEEVENQKKLIEQQKHIVEEKQKEITDSITYAQRLQQAILPPQELITQNIPDNFVFYQPKDIVAGDFYWVEQIDDLFFIAAADSTGHGVPGAIVSVVCSNALNRAVKEFNLTETGKILDKTRALVIETFSKSNENVKDGMDISLLCIDKQNKKISWSGAYNPLWYIQQGELQEVTADKQPIGKTEHMKPFVTHTMEYIANTAYYLFTDGYADQFGGPAGKKFKYKQFSQLLLENVHLSMKDQETVLRKAFASWKGNIEQVDDVCVIGIKA